jgi:hypothetical protein
MNPLRHRAAVDVLRGALRKSKPLPAVAESSRRAGLPDLAGRREILARAQAAAASLAEAAEAARLAALDPHSLAAELRNQAGIAALDVENMRRDVDHAEREHRARRPAAMPAKVANAAEVAATERALGLARIHAIAARHDVHFDLAAAIGGTVSVRQMGAVIHDKMVDESESQTVSSRVTYTTTVQANALDGWDQALALVVAKQGGSNSGEPAE